VNGPDTMWYVVTYILEHYHKIFWNVTISTSKKHNNCAFWFFLNVIENGLVCGQIFYSDSKQDKLFPSISTNISKNIKVNVFSDMKDHSVIVKVCHVSPKNILFTPYGSSLVNLVYNLWILVTLPWSVLSSTLHIIIEWSVICHTAVSTQLFWIHTNNIRSTISIFLYNFRTV